MKTFCILIAICFTMNTQARLGETTEQIEARYGKPSEASLTKKYLQSGLPHKKYKFKNYSVVVVFHEGKSIKETVIPTEYSATGEDESIELVKSIIGDPASKSWDKMVLRGDGWQAMSLTTEVRVWLNEYDSIVKTHREAVEKEQREQAKKKTEGF